MEPKHTPLDLFQATSPGSWIAVGVLVALLFIGLPGVAEAMAAVARQLGFELTVSEGAVAMRLALRHCPAPVLLVR